MTVLSKRMRRPVAAAAAETSGQLQAIGPLLAVTTSMPRRNASRTWPVAAGAYDVDAGRDAGEVAHHRELDEDVGAGGGEELGGRPSRLRRGRPVADRGEHLRRRHAGGVEQAAVARAGRG